MTRFRSVITILLALAAIGTSKADEITLESVPPVVVKTVPAAGSPDVDPMTTEIQVTISKKMADGTWSWSTLSKQSLPEVDGKPKYLNDERTYVLPVKLQPEKTYAIWINSNKFKNSKDSNGTPAVPYLLVFKTGK